ncbi:MAG: hypothetical protein ACLGGV_02600 [Bacteroidia bacterium]
MKFLLFSISLLLGQIMFAQEVTFKVKKGDEFSGLFYTKVKGKKEYQYLMFSGKEVSVWNSPEKPKNVLSNSDYMTFAKAKIKTTEFLKNDSLVTFEFKQNVKQKYVFLEYHCIVENDGSLHVKISNSNELIEVERYKLVRRK